MDKVKIGSEEQKAWSDILTQAVNNIKQSKREVEINETIAVLAERRMREEEAVFKKDEGKA